MFTLEDAQLAAKVNIFYPVYSIKFVVDSNRCSSSSILFGTLPRLAFESPCSYSTCGYSLYADSE